MPSKRATHNQQADRLGTCEFDTRCETCHWPTHAPKNVRSHCILCKLCIPRFADQCAIFIGKLANSSSPLSLLKVYDRIHRPSFLPPSRRVPTYAICIRNSITSFTAAPGPSAHHRGNPSQRRVQVRLYRGIELFVPLSILRTEMTVN